MTTPHTPLTFRLVPAAHIVVVSTTEGACRVLAGGSMIVGPTLCAVLDAACKLSAATPGSMQEMQ